MFIELLLTWLEKKSRSFFPTSLRAQLITWRLSSTFTWQLHQHDCESESGLETIWSAFGFDKFRQIKNVCRSRAVRRAAHRLWCVYTYFKFMFLLVLRSAGKCKFEWYACIVSEWSGRCCSVYLWCIFARVGKQARRWKKKHSNK